MHSADSSQSLQIYASKRDARQLSLGGDLAGLPVTDQLAERLRVPKIDQIGSYRRFFLSRRSVNMQPEQFLQSFPRL